MKIGIIGGSGVDITDMLTSVEKKKMHTPYGAHSGFIRTGSLGGIKVIFILRHGEQHTIIPSLVNSRANIWAMKDLGVTHILAPTACGSLREEIAPGHLVMIDQFIDRTTKRDQTFYEGNQVAHIGMADPFCEKLRSTLNAAATKLGLAHHDKGTMVTIEGPRFSTRAESHLFRAWGADVINMTTVPEAVLAREAGICYQPIAMSTDYDCWREGEAVTNEMVLATMKKNVESVKKLILTAIPTIKDVDCPCRHAIEHAMM
ncbi:MAG: S-methyl-5'-thioadenosine phosphorylase [Nanoarchaeota archaeon]